MKLTFVGQYSIAGSYPQTCEVDITLYAGMNEKIGTLMIHDREIGKTIVRGFDPRRMTVHKNFSIANGSTLYTAEQQRNQRMNSPNVNFGVMQPNNSKEIIQELYERDLIVPAGTFEKILKAFNIFPDPVEVLLFD